MRPQYYKVTDNKATTLDFIKKCNPLIPLHVLTRQDPLSHCIEDHLCGCIKVLEDRHSISTRNERSSTQRKNGLNTETIMTPEEICLQLSKMLTQEKRLLVRTR